MKGIIYSCFFTLASFSVMAQGNSLKPADPNIKTTTPKPVIKKPKPISREFSVGLKVSTDGWGIFADRGTVKSNDKYPDRFYAVRILQVEFSEHKSPYEIRRTNTLGSSSTAKPTPFIYGKINNFYTFKIGYGNRKLIAGKPETGNVSIHWVYLGGLSLGLQKPYYLVVDTGTNTSTNIKYSDKDRNKFLYKPNIIGSAGFTQGLGETSIKPGIQVKTALHFDFASSKNSVIAIEAGAVLEYYAGDVQIMANKDPQSLFMTAYMSFQFGKRW